MGVSFDLAVPPNHPFDFRIFDEINHPATGTSIFCMDTRISKCTREMPPEPGDRIAAAALLPREAPVDVGAVDLVVEVTGYPVEGG